MLNRNTANMTAQKYFEEIRKALNKALCLQNFASQIIERHNYLDGFQGIMLDEISQPQKLTHYITPFI